MTYGYAFFRIVIPASYAPIYENCLAKLCHEETNVQVRQPTHSIKDEDKFGK